MSHTSGFPELLSVLLFLPAAVGVALFLLPARDPGEEHGRWTPAMFLALGTGLVAFALTIYYVASISYGVVDLRRWPIQFAEHGTWLPSLGISYFLGIDGISVWLLPLCTGVMLLALLASCLMVNRRLNAFLALMLIAETGMLGVLLSWNLFLFYVFWEVMLVPAYFLVGMWGGARRIYATTKFVIYTIFGSFLMLVAIFYLYASTPGHNLDFTSLLRHPLGGPQQNWLFLAFMVALAVKAGLFPFHSWAPDTYVEAPVPATVMIASVMGKMATFAMIRFVLPILPLGAAYFSSLIEILAVLGILYGASMALVQRDGKRVLAYASISHMNIIVLGIFALNQQGLDGSLLQMVNHGVIMAGLFFMVALIQARTGTRYLDQISGIAKTFPILAAFGLVLFLAAMDLPGLGSFAGEFTILLGVFRSNAWFATVAGLVTILAAWYAVRWFQAFFHGPATAQAYNESGDGNQPSTVYEGLGNRSWITCDLKPLEAALLVPLAVVVVWLGVVPKPFTDRTTGTTFMTTAVVTSQANPARMGELLMPETCRPKTSSASPSSHCRRYSWGLQPSTPVVVCPLPKYMASKKFHCVHALHRKSPPNQIAAPKAHR